MGRLLALLLLGSEVSGVKVPLAKVVSDSALIVIASPAEVATREEALPLADPGQPDAGQFTRTRRRYLVREVLFAAPKTPAVKVGDMLELDDPNWALWRTTAYMTATHAPALSLFIPEYQSPCFPEAGGPHVFFLVRRGKDLMLTVSGAWETVANRSKVEAGLKKKP